MVHSLGEIFLQAVNLENICGSYGIQTGGQSILRLLLFSWWPFICCGIRSSIYGDGEYCRL